MLTKIAYTMLVVIFTAACTDHLAADECCYGGAVVYRPAVVVPSYVARYPGHYYTLYRYPPHLHVGYGYVQNYRIHSRYRRTYQPVWHPNQYQYSYFYFTY